MKNNKDMIIYRIKMLESRGDKNVISGGALRKLRRQLRKIEGK